MGTLPYVHNQVYPLSVEEMERILNATTECGFDVDVAYRIKVFILLQRWSGLACMEAATLRRDRLQPDNNLTRVQRNKTGAGVFVPLPPIVADALRSLQNDHPDYFFWNPSRMSKISAVAYAFLGRLIAESGLGTFKFHRGTDRGLALVDPDVDSTPQVTAPATTDAPAAVPTNAV